MTGQDSRLSLIERDLMVQAVAAYLPGAVRRERVENMLRALDAAGYQVVPKSAHPQGAVERAEKAEAENRLLRETCRINGWPEFGEAESTDLLRDGGQ